jgi:uncharacterized BrkB/YihY/UPF0761 family membrane protein
MDDFSYLTAASIFATYVVIDMLYAWYIMSVNKKRALTAAFLTAIIYSLLAFGVVSYSKNIYYLIPLASGAFTGTYLMVKFKE